MIYCNDQSYMKPSEKTSVLWQTKLHWDQALHSLWWSPEKRSEYPIYLHRWADSRYFGKAFVQDEKVVYLRNKQGLVEMNSLLKKEEITPNLGGRTDVLLIYGQSFFNSKNGPRWAVPFHFGKVVWYFWWTIIFQFGKWSISEINFHNENGTIDCWCTIDIDSPCGQCGGMV